MYSDETHGIIMIIHTKIQKWGNGLALRVGGIMREMPHFQEGSEVKVEVTENGFVVTKAKKNLRFPFKETELLENLSAETSHADLLTPALANEIGDK